jgi:hypothetical protein
MDLADIFVLIVLHLSDAVFYIVTCMSDYRRGLDLVIGFIERLQIVTTQNYNVIANSHTLQFTRARD